MPNWVMNKVVFYGDKVRINDIREGIKNDYQPINFNTLIPMPRELMMTEGSVADQDVKCFMAEDEIDAGFLKDKYHMSDEEFEEAKKRGEIYVTNKMKYGHRSWYGWCCENWGTKWNASESQWLDDHTLIFRTAWSTPIPIFEKMSEEWPDVKIDVFFADEDFGQNCGTISYENGYADEHSDFVDVEAAKKFAYDVWGYTDEEIKEMEAW